jgi:hypothetical protein
METLKAFADAENYEILIDDVDRWLRKDNPPEKNSAIVQAFHNGLNQLLKDSLELLRREGPDYFSAMAILENLNALGIVNDVSQKWQSFAEKKSVPDIRHQPFVKPDHRQQRNTIYL